MTRFGKLLIFLNLMLSITFAGWAAGVYSQRIDWAPARSLFTGELIEDRPGRVKELNDQVKGLAALRDLGEVRWQNATLLMVHEQQHRSSYQEWYAQELTTLRTGADADGKQVPFPVRELTHDPRTGDIDRAPIKDKEKAFLVNGEPLKSLEHYEEQYKELVKKIKGLQEEYAKRVKKAEEQSEDINGKAGERFGLRTEVLNLQQYLRNANDELAYLQPLYDSTTAELNTMMKRYLALKERKKKLEEYAAANR